MRYFILIFLILTAKAFAEDTPSVDLKTAHELVNALKSKDKASVARLIKYPISRAQPLLSIKDATEFVEHYDEFFDAKNIAEIEKGLSDIWTNWKGSSVGRGSIWISDGKVIAINVHTNLQEELAKKAKQKDSLRIHPSASHYDRVYYECKSKNHHIRIHENGKKLQYFSWPINTSLSKAPELILEGKWEQQGSGGNMNYTFTNKEYSYLVEEVHLCGETCDGYLVVKKGEKEVLKEVCNPIVK